MKASATGGGPRVTEKEGAYNDKEGHIAKRGGIKPLSLEIDSWIFVHAWLSKITPPFDLPLSATPLDRLSSLVTLYVQLMTRY